MFSFAIDSMSVGVGVVGEAKAVALWDRMEWISESDWSVEKRIEWERRY